MVVRPALFQTKLVKLAIMQHSVIILTLELLATVTTVSKLVWVIFRMALVCLLKDQIARATTNAVRVYVKTVFV